MPADDNSVQTWECAHAATTQDLHHRRFMLPGDQPRYLPTRRFDILHYRIELQLDFEARAIEGTTTLTVRSLSDHLASLVFDAFALEISAVTVGGLPVEWTVDGEHIALTLAQAAGWDDELSVAISYRTVPDRGLYFILPDHAYPEKHPHVWTQSQDIDARAWFPCYNLPYDKATSEMIATVPASMFVLSNGQLMEVTTHDTTKTYHWRQDIAHSAYLITLVAGPFVEIPDQLDQINVPAYVLPGREEDARRAFPSTRDMIAFFSEKIGVPYPYPQYAQVCVSDYIMGGMEHTSATTLTDTILPDERIMPEWSGTGLIAHELAHQWFGDLLTCRDWAHGWLNEGFATYFDALWHEHAKGVDEFAYKMFLNARGYLHEDTSEYRRPIVERTYSRPIDIFDAHLYPKGAWVLHMIRTQLGDEAWWRAINQYVTRHRGGTVITSDLERAIADTTGINLEKFFDQWLFTGGHPEFKVGWRWDAEQKLGLLQITQQQQIDTLTPIFDLPIDILFDLGSTEQRIRLRVDQAEQTFHIVLPEQPRRIRFDPDGAVLKTLTFPRPFDMLAYQLQNDPSITGRIEAAVELGKIADRRSVAALCDALQHERFWGVAVEIARTLGEVRTPAARDGLLAAVEHSDPRVRSAAFEHLGHFKHDEGIAGRLQDCFKSGDTSPIVEGQIAKSLGQIKAPAASEIIDAALERSSWNDVIRVRALEGVAALDDDRTTDLLVAWTAYGKPEQARIAATAGLGRDGQPDDIRRRSLKHLGELLEDPAMRVRRAAVAALSKLGDKSALEGLRRILVREQNGLVRRAARRAIQKIEESQTGSSSTSGLQEAIEKLTTENRNLRERIDALETRGDAKSS